jgi:hypothetical protein
LGLSQPATNGPIRPKTPTLHAVSRARSGSLFGACMFMVQLPRSCMLPLSFQSGSRAAMAMTQILGVAGLPVSAMMRTFGHRTHMHGPSKSGKRKLSMAYGSESRVCVHVNRGGGPSVAQKNIFSTLQRHYSNTVWYYLILFSTVCQYLFTPLHVNNRRPDSNTDFRSKARRDLSLKKQHHHLSGLF